MSDSYAITGSLKAGGDITAQNRERAIQAKKKRQLQLKKWQQYDKTADKDISRHRRQRPFSPGARANVDVSDGSRIVTFGAGIVLLEAATREDFDEVRRLLSKKVSPDLANEDGLTPLHQCCIDNAIDMCKLLLSFGANVNAKDSENWTPLHAAATCGHRDLCKLLIDNGADLLALNAEGNMPYDICDHETTLDLIETEMANRGITQQQIDEARLVPEKRMLVDVQRIARDAPNLLNELDPQGATLLHIAAANGYYEVAEFLTSRTSLATRMDKDGWLPCHVAACWGHLDIIELLVMYGADIDARTKSGESVFDICEDPDMQDRLRQIKRDADNLRHGHQRPLMRRKSSNNPRGASIRRTSVRDKSLTSWREAKQEAEIRLSKELELQQNDSGPRLATVVSPDFSPSFHHNNTQPEPPPRIITIPPPNRDIEMSEFDAGYGQRWRSTDKGGSFRPTSPHSATIIHTQPSGGGGGGGHYQQQPISRSIVDNNNPSASNSTMTNSSLPSMHQDQKLIRSGTPASMNVNNYHAGLNGGGSLGGSSAGGGVQTPHTIHLTSSHASPLSPASPPSPAPLVNSSSPSHVNPTNAINGSSSSSPRQGKRHSATHKCCEIL